MRFDTTRSEPRRADAIRIKTNRREPKRNDLAPLVGAHFPQPKVMKPQPNFKPSAATIAITELLSRARVGQTVTYVDMREAIGFPIANDRLRSSIASARASVQRDSGYVFSCVAKVGYQRLSGTEVVEASDRDVQHLRRTAIKTREKLLTVNDGDIDDATRSKRNARMLIAVLASQCCDTVKTKQLEGPRGSDPEALKRGMRMILFGDK